MRVAGISLLSSASVVGTTTSSAIDLTQMALWDIIATATDATPGNKTFVSGVKEVDTFNFPALVGATDGDYAVQWDTSGNAWAVALDTTGGAANTPTGAVWAAIPSGRKVYLNISAATDAASVATAVKAGFIALTGFAAVVTASDAAADGHLANTAVIPGVVTAPSVHNKNDSGAGSITVVVTTAGTATAVSLSADTVTVTAHGYTTGLKVQLTTSGGLPTGLATSTNYWLIAVDADTLAFATSLANAQAGTKIDLTGYGTGTQTVVPQALAGSIKLQKSDDIPGTASPTWFDIASSSQNYGASLNWTSEAAGAGYLQLRLVATTTSGLATVTAKLGQKGP